MEVPMERVVDKIIEIPVYKDARSLLLHLSLSLSLSLPPSFSLARSLPLSLRSLFSFYVCVFVHKGVSTRMAAMHAMHTQHTCKSDNINVHGYTFISVYLMSVISNAALLLTQRYTQYTSNVHTRMLLVIHVYINGYTSIYLISLISCLYVYV